MPLRVAYANLRVAHQSSPRNYWTKESIKPPMRSHEEVKEWFDNVIMIDWTCSPWCAQLKHQLQTIRPICSNVIAFGLGGFSRSWDGLNRDGCAMQRALLLTVWAVIRQGSKTAPCYAQDPVYSPVEKWVLNTHRILAVDDPQGFLDLDDDSAIVAINAGVCVKQIVTDLTKPALMLWDQVGDDVANDPR